MAEVEATVSGTSGANVEEKFQAALNVIKSLPKNGSYKPSYGMMLKFYSFYKQATEGPCTKSKPWAFDVVNKAKWDAWTRLGNMPKAKAMEKYVDNLKLIIEAMPATDDVQGFIRTLGNFYEVVELEQPEQLKKYAKLTSTPNKEGGAFVANGHASSQHKVNGDASESDSESDSEENEVPLTRHKATNGHEDDGSERGGDSQASESEDEFCDTAEEIHTSSDSPMHSYTVVNADGRAENSSKSGSISTMDSTMDGESSNQDESHLTSSTVKVRTRGGEHGKRGADRVPPVQGPSSGGGVGSVSSQNPGANQGNMVRPGASGGAGGGRGPPHSYSEVQDQIATTLLQLQQDMNSVLNRLAILEELTVGQQARHGRTISGDSGTSSNGSKRRSKAITPSWWPFSELSPKTLFFIIAWPFLARWIMNVWTKRQLRR